MNILITGSAGFIGFNLALDLCSRGYSVIGVDNLNDYYSVTLKKSRLNVLLKYKNFTFFKKDLNQLDELNPNLNIDLFINLAAQAGVRLPASKFSHYIHSNISGFNSVLDFCNKNSIKKLIYASSSSVYGDSNSIPFSEDQSISTPKSFYAASKIFNENLAYIHSAQNNLSAIGLRFFTVYGPWGRPDMAYFTFADAIFSQNELILNNKGEMERDMTYIDDIVQGINLSIEAIQLDSLATHQIFNLGNDYPVRTIQLIGLLEERLGRRAIIKHHQTLNEIESTHADLRISNSLLGYEPTISFSEGIDRFIDWFKWYKSNS
ncbi:NAD-dependent epimerase/dehydratase family protein [Gammaproteobacteria bacterium]|jgi:UDP-glucuronate 4-epimerase|nr:NAD-dependent epimerase/dehydratase family protein [Gammaproteobacteria bacterium]